MNRYLVATTAVTSFVVSAFVLWASGPNAEAAPPAPAPAKPAPVAPVVAPGQGQERAREIALGQHLVATSGCHDCHTPFKATATGAEPDMSRALSGHPEGLKMPVPPKLQGPWLVAVAATNTAWSGPWGVSYTANLTSDKETGLGAWTKQNFIQTIRTGRHLGRGRPLLPPMPVPVYNNFSDAELGAIYSYLQTVPAIKNRVPNPTPPAGAKPAHG